MTMREDLDRLAEECDVCALTDSASIDDHLLVCPSCGEHMRKVEQIESEVGRMRDLSTSAPIERRQLMGYDINDYLNMSEARRVDAVRDMFENTSELSEAERVALMRTRTDIMTSLPKREREAFMWAARKAYSRFDEARLEREARDVGQVVSSYNPLKGALVRRMYADLMRR